MLLNLIWTLSAAVLVGFVPGWFWAKLLSAAADFYERMAYSLALSLALVPAVALIPAHLFGTGVTLAVAIASPLLVFVGGLLAYVWFGPAKGLGENVNTSPIFPGTLALVPIIVAFALVLGSNLESWRLFWLARACWGWPVMTCVASGAAQRFVLPVALLLVAAGIVHLLTLRREPEPQVRTPEQEPQEGRSSPAVVLARRLSLPLVLSLALLRGYSGPMAHDWPFIRGVDHYSHTVMANLMMTQGEIEPYLIYPPGFHTMTAAISRLSGLDPLEVFPMLGPTLLLLPSLALYVLARQLWGWGYGVGAALFSLLLGGTYYYYNDAMYPNLVASQFLLVLAVGALIELYRSASVRTALLLALLGSSIVLYHQVASLYLAVLLALVGALFLPYLLLRERKRGLTLLSSLVLLGVLSVLYAWDTYNLPQLVGHLLETSGRSETSTAMSMAVGTQVPYGLRVLIGAIVSQPVAWLGLLGAILLVVGLWERIEPPQVLAYLTLLLWFFVLLAGSTTSYSGFPQRFGRDLGVPLALFAAFAFASILAPLLGRRKPVAVLAATLAVALAAGLIGLRAAQTFEQAAGASPFVMMTPEIAAAGEWLEEHNTGGNIMVSPHGTSIPSRMMLAMGDYSGLQSFEPRQIRKPRDLPPTGPKPLQDVLWVIKHPGGERTEQLLEKHDVRYVVLYKYTRLEGITTDYWPLFKRRPDLYRAVFENEHVLIVAPHKA